MDNNFLGKGCACEQFIIPCKGWIIRKHGAGGRALVLCWTLALVSLAFAVGSDGDWMNGFRWLAFLCVPASVLFAAGVGELRDVVRRWLAPAGRGSRAAEFAVVGVAAASRGIGLRGTSRRCTGACGLMSRKQTQCSS